jgi:hypothetical protein
LLDSESKVARGDIDIRRRLVWLVFWVVLILTVSGVAAFFWCPERFKDFWAVVGPIISGAVLGAVGYIAGENRALSKHRNE